LLHFGSTQVTQIKVLQSNHSFPVVLYSYETMPRVEEKIACM